MAASVRRLARAHPLDRPLDPLAAIAALRRRGPVVALETLRPSSDHGRQSIVAGDPLATFTWKRGRAHVERLRDGAPALAAEAVADAPTPFHALERLLAAAAITTEPREDAPPAGAFGYFGYECAAPAELPRLEPFPDAWFLLADTLVHWPDPDAPPVLWCAGEARASELLAALAEGAGEAERIGARVRLDRPAPDDAATGPGDLTVEEYARAFAAARGALARGESYQLCFTYPLVRRCADDPLLLHARLRRENPAPFSAFLSAPFGAIVASSPERFLRVDRAGRVEARPMKGTAARAGDARERATAGRELVTSAKTRAENLMIADLLRNDLGRVCRLGSVRAARPALLEEHATVLQLVSVIEGELERGRTRADLLAAAFPPGSMTGAPKVRSIEILRALEREPRGPYGGALGYVAADGRMDLAVVIRSALVAGGFARVNVGGGLVWDSKCAEELEESRLKAAPLLRALAGGRGEGSGAAGLAGVHALSAGPATSRDAALETPRRPTAASAVAVVLVDHQDSFTWNLAHAIGALTGALPRVLDSRELDPAQLAADPPELVVLGPGPGHPAQPRDAARSLELVRALPAATPLFGVCFGLQLLVTALGGVVVPAPEPVHGKPSPIVHDATGLFAGLPSPVAMMRYHSLVAERSTLPEAWRVTAVSPLGEVMAIEHATRPWWAVQFHPESVGSPDGARLLVNVIERARGRAGKRAWAQPATP